MITLATLGCNWDDVELIEEAGKVGRPWREGRLDAARCCPGGLGVGQHKLSCGQEKLFPHFETLWLKSAANEKRGERSAKLFTLLSLQGQNEGGGVLKGTSKVLMHIISARCALLTAYR